MGKTANGYQTLLSTYTVYKLQILDIQIYEQLCYLDYCITLTLGKILDIIYIHYMEKSIGTLPSNEQV